MRRRSPAVVAVSLALCAASANAQDARPTEPGIRVTVPWIATQLVPSPELAYGDRAAHFGLRWQLTPLLFSWGIHRGLSPWRFFVAEPYVRQSGSVELFVTPEYLFYGATFADGWGLRTGVRSYFPLVEHGEYLSFSLGSSGFAFEGHASTAYEVGVYVLFGAVGVQLTLSPTPAAAPVAAIATLRLRYF